MSRRNTKKGTSFARFATVAKGTSFARFAVLSHLATLLTVFFWNNNLVFPLNRVSGGELFEYLAEREKVSEDEAVEFLRQILEGVREMHEKNIAHLDLKVGLSPHFTVHITDPEFFLFVLVPFSCQVYV